MPRSLLPLVVASVLAAACGDAGDVPSGDPPATELAAPTEAETTTTAAAARSFGEWAPIAEAPIPPRAHAMAFWSGSEAVFWAGASLERNHAFTDAAAYDPRAETWRTIGTPGWGHPGLVGASLDGVLWAVAKGGITRFDPVDGTWADLPEPPGMEAGGVAATDDAVWAVGPARVLPNDDVDVAIARFDPQAYGWVPGPVFPAAPGAYPAFMGPLSVSQPLLWTGTEIVIWDPEGGGGAAFDPGALAWRPLPAPTGRGAAGSRAVVAAGELVVVAQSGEGLAIGRVEDGAWTWRDLALSVGDVAAVTAAAAGEWVVLLLPGQGPVTYHVPTGAWAQHVDAPLADLQAPNTVWTGDRLIVWGGAAPSSPLQSPLAAGAVWIPPGG